MAKDKFPDSQRHGASGTWDEPAEATWEDTGPKMDRLEAGARTFGTGLTFGAGERFSAMLSAGLAKLTGQAPDQSFDQIYETDRKENLGKTQKARADYPVQSVATEMAGAVISPLNKVLAPLTAAKKVKDVATGAMKMGEAAKIASLPTAVRGMTEGAAYGAAQAQGEWTNDALDNVKDTARASATGLIAPAFAGTAKGVGKGAKKVAGLMGVSQDAIEHVAKVGGRVSKSKETIEEIVPEWRDALAVGDMLRSHLSGKAREAIPDDALVQANGALQSLSAVKKRLVDSTGTPHVGQEKAFKDVKKLEAVIKRNSAKVKEKYGLKYDAAKESVMETGGTVHRKRPTPTAEAGTPRKPNMESVVDDVHFDQVADVAQGHGQPIRQTADGFEVQTMANDAMGDQRIAPWSPGQESFGQPTREGLDEFGGLYRAGQMDDALTKTHAPSPEVPLTGDPTRAAGRAPQELGPEATRRAGMRMLEEGTQPGSATQAMGRRALGEATDVGPTPEFGNAGTISDATVPDGTVPNYMAGQPTRVNPRPNVYQDLAPAGTAPDGHVAGAQHPADLAAQGLRAKTQIDGMIPGSPHPASYGAPTTREGVPGPLAMGGTTPQGFSPNALHPADIAANNMRGQAPMPSSGTAPLDAAAAGTQRAVVPEVGAQGQARFTATEGPGTPARSARGIDETFEGVDQFRQQNPDANWEMQFNNPAPETGRVIEHVPMVPNQAPNPIDFQPTNVGGADPLGSAATTVQTNATVNRAPAPGEIPGRDARGILQSFDDIAFKGGNQAPGAYNDAFRKNMRDPRAALDAELKQIPEYAAIQPKTADVSKKMGALDDQGFISLQEASSEAALRKMAKRQGVADREAVSGMDSILNNYGDDIGDALAANPGKFSAKDVSKGDFLNRIEDASAREAFQKLFTSSSIARYGLSAVGVGAAGGAAYSGSDGNVLQTGAAVGLGLLLARRLPHANQKMIEKFSADLPRAWERFVARAGKGNVDRLISSAQKSPLALAGTLDALERRDESFRAAIKDFRSEATPTQQEASEANLPGVYMEDPRIQEAYKKSPRNARALHYVLMRKDPEYRANAEPATD